MAELRLAMTEAGLEDVDTYIQSGNITFEATYGVLELEQRIEKQMSRSFRPGIRTIVRSQADLERIVRSNPLLNKASDVAKLHVTFLGTQPMNCEVPGDYAPDEFTVIGREVYLHCPGGYGTSKINNAFFERKLGVVATTRNWKTVTALQRLVSR